MTFDEFARTRLLALLRFAKVLCVDRGTAEEVLQEVLLRAYARWDTIAALDVPETYVRRMIVNEYLSWRRKWSRIAPVPMLTMVADGPDASDPVGRIAQRDELVAEIARLPRRQRAVVVLRYYGGLSDTEIAADLGCTAGTVRSHLSRALAAMRVRITTVEEIDDGGERLAH